jgi:hypothetical protein
MNIMALEHHIFSRHKLTTSITAGAAAIGLAIGAYAIAGTASNGMSGSSNVAAAATLQGSSGVGPTPPITLPSVPGRSARVNADQTVNLTDHERYVRHHERLASLA